MKIHIGFIKEGTILHFPNSAYDYMKVCGRTGIGGVVNLSTGLYISTSELEEEGGFYMKTLVSDLQAEVEERLKEIFI